MQLRKNRPRRTWIDSNLFNCTACCLLQLLEIDSSRWFTDSFAFFFLSFFLADLKLATIASSFLFVCLQERIRALPELRSRTFNCRAFEDVLTTKVNLSDQWSINYTISSTSQVEKRSIDGTIVTTTNLKKVFLFILRERLDKRRERKDLTGSFVVICWQNSE